VAASTTVKNRDEFVQKYPQYATPKKMGRLNKMIAFNVLIVVMIWIYDFLVTLGESADGPLFEGVFGLTRFTSTLPIRTDHLICKTKITFSLNWQHLEKN